MPCIPKKQDSRKRAQAKPSATPYLGPEALRIPFSLLLNLSYVKKISQMLLKKLIYYKKLIVVNF